MKNICISDALKLGIAAHQKENFKEADKYYTAILRVLPDHPDANHNMGLLAINYGQTKAALNFIRKAINANKNIFQFHKSYIKALISLDMITEARFALEEARTIFVAEEETRQLSYLADKIKDKFCEIEGRNSLLEALNLLECGKFADAINILEIRNKRFPNDIDTITALTHCYFLNDDLPNAKLYFNKSKEINSSQLYVRCNEVRILLKDKEVSKAVYKARQLHEICPDNPEVNVILGSALRLDNNPSDSLTFLDAALDVRPDYAEALLNRGLVKLTLGQKLQALKDLGRAFDIKPHFKQIQDILLNLQVEHGEFEAAIELLNLLVADDPNNEKYLAYLGLCHQNLQNYEEALTFYNKTIQLNPKNPKIHNNCGVIHKELGDFDLAFKHFTLATKLDPSLHDTMNNLGIIHENRGEIKEAIQCFEKVLKQSSKSISASENLLTLSTQLKTGNEELFSVTEQGDCINVDTEGSIKVIVLKAIDAYIKGNISDLHTFLKLYSRQLGNNFKSFDKQDQRFFEAYILFLSKLIKFPEIIPDASIGRVYHLGESHCLSYAHQKVAIKGTFFQIQPRITFGTKAFHLSTQETNKYQEITKINFNSIPDQSKLFISFGEIDCRPNEGFIVASQKSGHPIEALVRTTVSGMLKWFQELNDNKSHDIWFLNVPAPTFDKAFLKVINSQVSGVVALYNQVLEEEVKLRGFKLLDVYKLSRSATGFSNGDYHIDAKHLGPSILKNLVFQ